jgi:hypothetical protein
MPHRALLALFLSWVLALQSGAQEKVPIKAASDSPQVSVGELRQRLYQAFEQHMRAGDVSVPWTVLNALVQQQMNNVESKAVRLTLFKNSSLASPIKAEELVASMRAEMAQIQVGQLQSIGLSTALASDTDLGPQNNVAYQFSAALQTSTKTAFSQIKEFEQGLATTRNAALSRVLSDSATPQILGQAQAAATELQNVLARAQLSANDLKALQAGGDRILNCLKKDATVGLGAIPVEVGGARAYYEKLADLAASFPGQVSNARRTLAGLTTDRSVDLLTGLGHLKMAQQVFSGQIAQNAELLRTGLQNGINQLNGGWDKLLSAALNAPITDGVLPAEVKRLAPFVKDFANLKEMLGRGTPSSASEISEVLFTSGIISKNSGVGQAASAVSTIMQLKGNYSNAASAVLDTVSKLNSAGVPIPGLKEAAPLLSSATSIIQAAGPLLALTGFGAGFSAFSALGGFGGGGSDNSAQFAAIQQQLSVINAKLDQVLTKLDALDKKITAQHEQVMNALEALGFDVERTRDILVNSVVHQTVRGPCRAAAEASDGTLREQHINVCNDHLQQLYAANDIPGILTLKANLVTQSLKQSALDKFRQELTIRQILVSFATDLDCGGLDYPSHDIDNLNRKLARYTARSGESSCSLLVLGAPLLEPGILEEYVANEQDALNATALLGRGKALNWWHDNGAQVRGRWTNHELPILNQAIAQQAIVSGDLLLPSFAKFLDDGSELDKVTQVWNDRGVFAENVVRYWIWTRLQSQTWMRTLYSLAWNSQNDQYWSRIFCQPNQADCGVKNGVHFSQEQVKTVKEDGSESNEMAWFATFGNLPKVLMPKPSEMYTLELRWPATLTTVVASRDRLLSASGGMEFVSQLWDADDAVRVRTKNILEGLAVSGFKQQVRVEPLSTSEVHAGPKQSSIGHR